MENQILSLNLTNIIESLIFAADKPLTAAQICEIVNTPCEDTAKIEGIKNTLMREAYPEDNPDDVSEEETTEEETEMQLSEQTDEENSEEDIVEPTEDEVVEPTDEIEEALEASSEELEQELPEAIEENHEESTETVLEAESGESAPAEAPVKKEDDKSEEQKINDDMIDDLFSIDDVLESIETIKLKYNSLAETPIKLCEIGDAFQLRTNPYYGKFIRNLKIAKPVKLTKSALETLAILAYKQPITRTEIDAIRGVDSGYSIRFLSEKKLCKILGKKDIPGRPILYGTTDEFLSLFSLKNLSSLPTIREFKELTEKHTEKVNDLFIQPSMEELKDGAAEIQRFTETDDENIAEIDQALSESRKIQSVEKILSHEIMQDPKEEEEGEEGENLEASESNLEEQISPDSNDVAEETLEASNEINEDEPVENLEESEPLEKVEPLEASEEDNLELEAASIANENDEDDEDEEIKEIDLKKEDIIEAYTAPIENNNTTPTDLEKEEEEENDEDTAENDDISDSDLYEKEVLDQIEECFEEETTEIDRDAAEIESVPQENELKDDPEIGY